MPAELFQGVAVLLAFVHRLGNRRSLGGIHLLPFDIEALAIPERTARPAVAADELEPVG